MHRRVHYAWAVFAATAVLSFVGFGLTVNTASLYWASLEQDLGVPLASVSLMGTITGIAGAVALLGAGTLFEKIDVRWALGGMIVAATLAYGLSAVAPNLVVLYVANVVLGAVKAIAFGFVIPLLLGNWFDKHLGLVVGITGALTAIGGAVFSPIMGSVIEASGWRTGYVVTGVIVLVTLLPLALFVVRLAPTGDQKPYGYAPAAPGVVQAALPTVGVSASRAYRSAPFYGFVAIGILLQLTGALVQHIPTYFTTIGIGLTAASSIYALLLIGASVGKLAIGAAIDHLNPILVAAVFVAIAIGGWGILLAFRGDAVLSTGSFMAGIGQAVNLVAVPVLIRTAFGARDYGKILAKVLVAGSLANAGGVYLHGLLYSATGSYRLSLTLDMVFYAVAFVLIVLALPAGRRLLRRETTAPAVGEAPEPAVGRTVA